jgi:N-acetylmuramoyl-L-alanine amidase
MFDGQPNITGGVVSSLGKGLASAALGALLQARGYRHRIESSAYADREPAESSNMKRRTQARLRDLANCALLLLAVPALGATIDAVRVEQTRVIFDVSAPVTFQVFTLTDPHRVVVDLERTRPRSGVDVSDAQPVGGDVTGVRGGPRGADGYRVVLDVQSPVDPNGFLMAPDGSYGDRLVVDLHGSARMTAVKTAPRASTSPTGQAPRKFVVAIDAGHGGEDPGAIGVAAARAVPLDPDIAVVALGTAHPAKFPDAVEKATGIRPALPPALADLYERPERFTVLPKDLAVVQAHIRHEIAKGEAA